MIGLRLLTIARGGGVAATIARRCPVRAGVAVAVAAGRAPRRRPGGDDPYRVRTGLAPPSAPRPSARRPRGVGGGHRHVGRRPESCGNALRRAARDRGVRPLHSPPARLGSGRGHRSAGHLATGRVRGRGRGGTDARRPLARAHPRDSDRRNTLRRPCPSAHGRRAHLRGAQADAHQRRDGRRVHPRARVRSAGHRPAARAGGRSRRARWSPSSVRPAGGAGRRAAAA